MLKIRCSKIFFLSDVYGYSVLLFRYRTNNFNWYFVGGIAIAILDMELELVFVIGVYLELELI